MDIKVKIREVLREHYGDFETYLEVKYETTLAENLLDGSMTHKAAWATYNQVILELKNSLKDMLRVKELQYKLTDKSDPNEVCMEVLENVKTETPELERLYWKIANF